MAWRNSAMPYGIVISNGLLLSIESSPFMLSRRSYNDRFCLTKRRKETTTIKNNNSKIQHWLPNDLNITNRLSSDFFFISSFWWVCSLFFFLQCNSVHQTLVLIVCHTFISTKYTQEKWKEKQTGKFLMKELVKFGRKFCMPDMCGDILCLQSF